MVVPHTLRARGRKGIEVQRRQTQVYTVEDGRVSRVAMYQETEEALAATDE